MSPRWQRLSYRTGAGRPPVVSVEPALFSKPEKGARSLATGSSTRLLPVNPARRPALNIQPVPQRIATAIGGGIIGAAPQNRMERGCHDGSRQSDITHHHGHYRTTKGSAFACRTAGSIRQRQQETARRCDASVERHQGTAAGRSTILLQPRRLSRRAVPWSGMGIWQQHVLGRLLQSRQRPVSHVAQGLPVEAGRGDAKHRGV